MSESLETTTGSSLRLTSRLQASSNVTGKAHLVFAAAILADRISTDEILEGLRKGLNNNDNRGWQGTRANLSAADAFLGDIVLRLAKEYGWTGRMLSGKPVVRLFIMKTSA